MKKGLLTAGVAVTLIGGGIAGTTAFAASDSQDDDVSQEQLEKAASITKDEAISASLEEVPGEAVGTELDDEDGKPVYEVDVKGEDGKMWDFEVDAKSGDVLNSEEEGRDDDEEDDDEDEVSDQKEQKQLKKEAKLTSEKSQSIATEEVNGEVIDSELDEEDGSVVYSVEIKDDQGVTHEVQVDAKTGDVLNTEENDDEDDDDEDEKDDEDDDEEDDD